MKVARLRLHGPCRGATGTSCACDQLRRVSRAPGARSPGSRCRWRRFLVLHASTFEVAALGVVEFLPFVLFSLPAGVWATGCVAADPDRGRLGPCRCPASIPLAYVDGGFTLGQLYAVGLLTGSLTVCLRRRVSVVSAVTRRARRDRRRQLEARSQPLHALRSQGRVSRACWSARSARRTRSRSTQRASWSAMLMTAIRRVGGSPGSSRRFTDATCARRSQKGCDMSFVTRSCVRAMFWVAVERTSSRHHLLRSSLVFAVRDAPPVPRLTIGVVRLARRVLGSLAGALDGNTASSGRD